MDDSDFSFRFQSSFEDHNTRHSWILGLWCHSCFETVCTHITETGSTCMQCSACAKKSSEKRAYLRTRGLNKSQKLGAVKVFYNQCQFVEHMKMHRLSTVNMGDLMLIPLPVDMNNSDWSPEFEIVCEVIMERAFLLRIHIIDWLKMYNLQDNWWKLIDGKSNDSMINEILEGYQGRQLFNCENPTADIFTNFSSNVVCNVNKSSVDIEFIDNNSMDKNTNNHSANIISDKNILENEDNPCTPTDITFVDCGPTSQLFEPEVPINYAHRRQVTAQKIKDCRLTNVNANKVRMNTTNEANRNSLETNIVHENTTAIKAGNNDLIKICSNKNLKPIIQPSLKDYVQFVKTTADNNFNKLITEVRKIPDNPIRIGIPFSAKKSIITKANLNNSEQNLQTSIANSNSKVLTIQDSKNIASISQLPSHLISNKKVVVIEQDSCNVIVHSENEVTIKKDLNNSVIDNGGTGSNMLIQKMGDLNVKKQEITRKIVIRNGKKYLIKRFVKNITKDPRSSSLSILKNTAKTTKQLTSEHNTSKSNLSSTNSNEAENIGMEQTPSPHNISLLTPSPSPSELSSSSSCELHVKKTAIMPKLQKVPPHLISISAMQSTQKHILETISLIKEENGDLYMDIKEVDRIPKESFRDVCDVIIKYRREMFDEFHQMNSLELQERIDHLQQVNEEMEQVLHFISESVFQEKLKSFNTLKYKLEECLKKFNQDVQDKKSDDVILNEWETKVDPVHKCLSCNRFMKPKSYIAGFSKLPKNDNAYCLCYKQVCHECLSYQGNTSRFIAHQNFHKKSKPYICPDCNSKCNSVTSLEVHTWTVCFHTLKKITFTCKICEIDGFRDVESITRHFVVMHSKTKIGCEDCSRVFTLYSEYIEHCTKTHPSKMEQNPIRLVICKLSNVILRCENYMSYLQKYPGIRKLAWFKCPFCYLITTDNKHVTTLLNTHIRKNHVESLSKVLSKEAFIEIFNTEFLNTESVSQQFLKTAEDMSANEMSCMNDPVIPRIVNTRTISSEIFERGSQNTEYMWSTNSNEIVKENLSTMKKIGKKRELLPKIINVRSMNDLKSSKSEEAITKFSTETKKKSNSLSLQTIIEIEDKKVLDDSKEEIAKTKETDKDNNELTMNASRVSESETPLLIDTVDVNLPIVPSKKDSNSASEANTENRIKIVDFRKICKPDIEQCMIAEMYDIQKDENASCTASMPKPPPLARIPQHLLEPIEIDEPKTEPANDSKKKKTKKSVRRIADKSKVRIALGTGTQKEGNIDYLCHVCNERINTSQCVLQAHFSEKHSDKYRLAVITPQLSRMSPDFINGGYKQFVNNKKRKSDSALYASKKKRRWTPKKHVEIKDVNPPVGLCVEQETAEDGEGNFICKKCGQRCADMSSLREHIAANHRLKGRYLICLECGENFVVVPSLQMHLKAFHGIDDPINYMNQNPSYAPDVDSDLQTVGRTTVANQCYVCMAVFEDKAAVDKHLRVHGMAFLNRKRIEARNALEKKVNTKEDKPSVIKDDPKEITKQDKPAETILEKITVSKN